MRFHYGIEIHVCLADVVDAGPIQVPVEHPRRTGTGFDRRRACLPGLAPTGWITITTDFGCDHSVPHQTRRFW